jgi:cell division protease FtsH
MVDWKTRDSNTALWTVFWGSVPWILFLLILYYLFMRQLRAPGAGGNVLTFGRSRAKVATRESTGVTFSDVAGIQEAKEEVVEIIEFLKNPKRFQRLGGRIPRGIMLVGSPGTGKTLLAKAIAGEAEVPFFSICGSDFVEMFVGVGASRVRDLFRQARENSPCIIFLDEVDAVGRRRGTGLGGGHDEREQTLNAILVEMDGFNSDEGIILVAATNRPDVLDPALLRPGRFDREIVLDLPDVKGREEILRVHSRKVEVHPDVDLERIARATPAFSGAELAALVNEAAIIAAMKDRDAVLEMDLEEARDKIRWGRQKRSRVLTDEDRRLTAYHEAGHALAAHFLPEVEPLHKVTIIPRGRALGVTMQLPETDRYSQDRERLMNMIAVLFGGRIAEELFMNQMTTGASNDFERATELARRMVTQWGMSDELGPMVYGENDSEIFLGRSITTHKNVSEATMQKVDSEIRRIIDQQYALARQLLEGNRDKVEAMAKALLELETIDADQIGDIMSGKPPRPPKPSGSHTPSKPPAPDAGAEGATAPAAGA